MKPPNQRSLAALGHNSQAGFASPTWLCQEALALIWSMGAQISLRYVVRKDLLMKGFFKMDVACSQIWVCLTFLLAELGRRQHPSHGPAAALPAENWWHFSPPGRSIQWCEWVGDGDPARGCVGLPHCCLWWSCSLRVP